MKTKFTKRMLSILLAVLMVVSMMPTTVFAATSTDGNLSTLKIAIDNYETKMNSGNVYTNLKAAYEAYLPAVKAYDAKKYGYTDSDLATLATNLNTAVNNMAEYSFDSAFTSVAPGGFNADNGTYTDGTSHRNLLYNKANTNTNGTDMADCTDADVQLQLLQSKTVLYYDGTNTPMFPVMFVAHLTADKPRYVHNLYPTTETIETNIDYTTYAPLSSIFAMNSEWRGNTGSSHYTRDWFNARDGGSGISHTDSAGNKMVLNTGASCNPKTFYWANGAGVVTYKGTPSNAVEKYSIMWFKFTGDGISDGMTFAAPTPTYVINKKGIKERVENIVKLGGNDIQGYRNGGLSTIFENVDKLTIDYSNTAQNYDANADTLMKTLNTAYSALATPESSFPAVTDLSGYEAIRSAMDSTATVTTNGTEYTIRQLGDSIMADDSYVACFTGFAAFKTAFKAAAEKMAAVNSNGYSDNANCATAANNLITAFNNLTESHSESLTKTVAGTCTTAGYQVYTCDNCGKQRTVTGSIDSNNHNYDGVEFTPEYETAKYNSSFMYTHAKACNNAPTDDNHKLVGECSFDFEAWEDIVEEDGSVVNQKVTCSVCGGTAVRVKPASTYTVNFYIKDEGQSDEQYVLLDTIENIAKDETPSLDSALIPAFDNDNHYSYSWVEELAPATADADYHIIRTVEQHNLSSQTLEASCTESGKIIYTCSICGFSKTEDDPSAPAKGHSFNYENLNNGKHNKVCSVCSYTEYNVSCTYGEPETIAPTCTENGYDKFICQYCSYELHDNFISALGHTKGTPVETERVPATCLDTGYYVLTTNCSICGAFIENEKIVLDALGHNVVTTNYEATCTEDAYFTEKCENYGHVATEHDNIKYSILNGFEYSDYTGSDSDYPYIERTGVESYEAPYTVTIANQQVQKLVLTFDYSVNNGSTGYVKIFNSDGSEAFSKSKASGTNQTVEINGSSFVAQVYKPGNSNAGKIEIKSIKVYVQTPSGITKLTATGHNYAYAANNDGVNGCLGTHLKYCVNTNSTGFTCDAQETEKHTVTLSTNLDNSNYGVSCTYCDFTKTIHTTKDTFRITQGNIFDFDAFAASASATQPTNGSAMYNTTDDTVVITGYGDNYTSHSYLDNMYVMNVDTNTDYALSFDSSTGRARVLVFGYDENKSEINVLKDQVGAVNGSVFNTGSFSKIYIRYGTTSGGDEIVYDEISNLAIYKNDGSYSVLADNVARGTNIYTVLDNINQHATDTFCSYYYNNMIENGGSSIVGKDDILTTNINVTPHAQHDLYKEYVNNEVAHYYCISDGVGCGYNTDKLVKISITDDNNGKIDKTQHITINNTSGGYIRYVVTYSDGTSSSATTSSSVVTLTPFATNDSRSVTVTANYIGTDSSIYDGEISHTALNDYKSTMLYHESFDDASVSGSRFTSSNGNATLNVADSAAVLDGYGVIDGNNKSSDYRKNVLKVNSSTSAQNGNYIKFDSNPAVNSVAVQQQGLTLSFWRAYEENLNVEHWHEAIRFAKPDSYDNNRGIYYYFETCGTGISSFNHGDGNGVSSDYYDFIPQNQDPTTHAAGNNTKYWMNIVVTIDPTSGVTIYTNGEPHPVTSAKQCGGKYSDFENDAELAQDILAFITESDTEFRLIDGDAYNNSEKNTYFDDIRMYSGVLTQVDIHNMYTSDDTDYNRERIANGLEPLHNSAAHDPTAVTVYTLVGETDDNGNPKTVGQEYIDYHNIDVNDKSKVSKIDYYIFGTGMTIYHSTNNVDWEVVGDSEGRCGYQNQQLYGGEYTVAIKEQLDFASHTDGGHTGQNKEPSDGAGYLQWAPHIMYNINADCWQYYGSTSSWGAMDSCIFTGNSESICGPYQNIKTVFASCNNYASSSTPANAIDACVYYGHNADGSINPNEMYMLYGSWQPIYVIQLDPTTGQNKYYNSADPYGTSYGTGYTDEANGYHYYGKIICTGNTETDAGGSGEGGFMIYENGYYYLYVSLGSNYGNYNLRVFRSEYPDRGFKIYTGEEATDTTASKHGMSLLSSYYLPIYDYAYTSIGHNSAYKVVNDNNEILTVDSVHARTFSTSASSNGMVSMEDQGMITRQIDLTGNISIQNMLAYTETGWQVAFPLQYNGTDTTVGIFTASDIVGTYSYNDLLTSAVSDYSRPATMSIVACDETHGYFVIGDASLRFELTYGKDYANQDITYITCDSYEGVIGKQGSIIEFAAFNKTTDQYTWGYQTSKSSDVGHLFTETKYTPANGDTNGYTDTCCSREGCDAIDTENRVWDAHPSEWENYSNALTLSSSYLQQTAKYSETSRNAYSAEISSITNGVVLNDETKSAAFIDAKTSAIESAFSLLEIASYTVKLYVLSDVNNKDDDNYITYNQVHLYGDVVPLSVNEGILPYKWTKAVAADDQYLAGATDSVSLVVAGNITVYAFYNEQSKDESVTQHKITVLNKYNKPASYIYVEDNTEITFQGSTISYNDKQFTFDKLPFYDITEYKVNDEIIESSYTVTSDIEIKPVYTALQSIVITLGTDTIKFKNDDASTREKSVRWDDRITVTADSEMMWYADGVPVAKGNTYTFRASTSVTITAQPVEQTTETPKSIVSYAVFDNENKKAIIAVSNYQSDNYKIEEQGIIFGTSKNANAQFDRQLIIDKGKKFVANKTTDTGDQFSFSLAFDANTTVRTLCIVSYVKYEGIAEPVYSEQVTYVDIY